MKFVVTIFFGFCMCCAHAQKEGKESNKDLLPKTAFNKMVLQDITYAIFGESSPVSGIKVDISKPDATISGFFKPLRKKKYDLLFGLEFKGGITDKSWSIFKGQNTYNTTFEFRPTFHIIPKWSAAKYYKKTIPVLKAKNIIISARKPLVVDSFSAVVFIYNLYIDNYPSLLDKTKKLPAEKFDLVKHFIKEMLGKTDGDFNLMTKVSETKVLIPTPAYNSTEMPAADYKEKVFAIYEKYKKLFNSAGDEEVANQIANVDKAWTLKKYWWITVGPYARTEKITGYHTKYNGFDSLYFRADYPLYGGLGIWLNHYRLWPNKVALFFRGGLTFASMNNLASLSSFNYETRTHFFSAGMGSTEKVKTGTAYTYSKIQTKTVMQLSGEFYALPLKTFVPGGYLSFALTSSKLYNLSDVIGRENDKTLVPVEGGVVFNVNSREKDKEKSILSISLYARYEDVTDKRRTSKETNELETYEEYMKRNFSLGIKFGIPITLPQRER